MKTRRDFLKMLGVTTAGLLLPAGHLQAAPRKKNVLFIAVDDLRPQLGCYGDTRIQSPNIDRLASQGMLFERAYCQQAICMASRASLMSGYRPDKGKIYDRKALYTHVPDALPVNAHFLQNGYETLTMGKVYHHRRDEKQGWSKPAFHEEGKWAGRGYLDKESMRIAEAYDNDHPDGSRSGMGLAYEHPDVADTDYADGILASHAIEELNRVKNRPFFMAVGFHKPHLPFNAPRKYWDMYKDEDIALADNPFLPKGAPELAATDWGELRGYHGIPAKGRMPDALARNLIHAYYACISYVDAQIGRVLGELDRLGLRDNTVVVLWGDHGWKLGEHSLWSKHTNFELDTRVPLILCDPKMKSAGRTTGLTELVDIYPTLCELCGLELPGHLEGASMVPLLEKPDRPWKKAAFSQYPRGSHMGYSMRTDEYRYTEWRKIDTQAVLATELYDHVKDTDENVNIADMPSNASLVERLRDQLNAGYKAALPPI